MLASNQWLPNDLANLNFDYLIHCYNANTTPQKLNEEEVDPVTHVFGIMECDFEF